MKTQQQSTAKGFAILSLAGILNKILALAYLPIQTAIVGNYGNGLITSGYKIYIFIYALSNAGIPVAISKLISEQNTLGNYRDSQKILKISLYFLLFSGFFYSAVLALGAQWISNQMAQPKAYLMILAISPTFIFTAISSAFRGYFQGNRNMYPTAISQVLEQLLNSVLTVIFAYLLIQYGVEYAAAGTTIGTSVGALGTAIFLIFFYLHQRKRRLLPHAIGENGTLTNTFILKQLLIYSLPAIIGTIATSASDLIDLKVGVSRMMDGGIDYYRATELFGIFSNQFQRIINLSLALTAALAIALIPAISSANATRNTRMLTLKINESFRAMYIFTIPCVVGIAALAQPTITFIFFSFKYNQGADLLIMGSWLALVIATMNIQQAILIGVGKPYIAPINLLIGMLLKVILNYTMVVIPFINIKGAIIGTAFGWLLACIMNHYFIKKHAAISINYWRFIYRPLAFSLIISAIAYFVFYGLSIGLRKVIASDLILNDVSLLIAIGVAAFTYLYLMIKTKTLEPEDMARIPFGHKISSLIHKR